MVPTCPKWFTHGITITWGPHRHLQASRGRPNLKLNWELARPGPSKIDGGIQVSWSKLELGQLRIMTVPTEISKNYLTSSMNIKLVWLVVGPPLWKIWKSVGMMTFPIYGKIKNVNQTTNQLCKIWDVNVFETGGAWSQIKWWRKSACAEGPHIAVVSRAHIDLQGSIPGFFFDSIYDHPKMDKNGASLNDYLGKYGRVYDHFLKLITHMLKLQQWFEPSHDTHLKHPGDFTLENHQSFLVTATRAQPWSRKWCQLADPVARGTGPQSHGDDFCSVKLYHFSTVLSLKMTWWMDWWENLPETMVFTIEY